MLVKSVERIDTIYVYFFSSNIFHSNLFIQLLYAQGIYISSIYKLNYENSLLPRARRTREHVRKSASVWKRDTRVPSSNLQYFSQVRFFLFLLLYRNTSVEEEYKELGYYYLNNFNDLLHSFGRVFLWISVSLAWCSWIIRQVCFSIDVSTLCGLVFKRSPRNMHFVCFYLLQ